MSFIGADKEDAWRHLKMEDMLPTDGRNEFDHLFCTDVFGANQQMQEKIIFSFCQLSNYCQKFGYQVTYVFEPIYYNYKNWNSDDIANVENRGSFYLLKFKKS